MQPRTGAFDIGEFTGRRLARGAALVALTLATHAIVIAAPGFYSR
jgi:hypothetical protein